MLETRRISAAFGIASARGSPEISRMAINAVAQPMNGLPGPSMAVNTDNRRSDDEPTAMAGRLANVQAASEPVAPHVPRKVRSAVNQGDFASLLQGSEQVIAGGIEAYIGELDPPNRYRVASELLRSIGLDPERAIKIPENADAENTPGQGEHGSGPAYDAGTGAGRVTADTQESAAQGEAENEEESGEENVPPDAAHFYIYRNTLSAQDLQWMSGRQLSSQEVLDMQRKLPLSLGADIDRRFDDFANKTAARVARFVQIWIASLANRDGVANPANARITMSRAAVYRTGETDAHAPVAPASEKQGLEIEGDGYLVSIRTPDGERRYFLSTMGKRAESIPAADILATWVDRHRTAVFGEWVTRLGLNERMASLGSRVEVSELDSGSLIDMGQWFTARARRRLEVLRQTV